MKNTINIFITNNMSVNLKKHNYEKYKLIIDFLYKN